MVHRPTRVGTVGSCIAFEEDSPGVFHLSSRKNTQAMQDPQELINVQTVSNVRSCVALPGVNFLVLTFGLLVDPRGHGTLP